MTLRSKVTAGTENGTRHIHVFRALLFREWILMRTWIIGFTLVAIAGPVINLMNTLGASSDIRLLADAESIYLANGLSNGIGVVNHKFVATFLRPNVPLLFHGAPPASLWVIAVAISLAALLATFDRQISAMTDTCSAPVRKNEWVKTKFLFGILSLLFIMVLRTMMIALLNQLSPWHFPASTMLFSGIVNLTIALGSFSIVFFVGQWVGNILLAWSLGFLSLSLPLELGAVIHAFNFTPNVERISYTIEHTVFLKLSPFWYTDYSSNFGQQFFPQKLTSETLTTPVNHPWFLAIGALTTCIIMYSCTKWFFSKVRNETSANLFASPSARHACLLLACTVGGSTFAQIFNHDFLLVFVITTLVLYGVLWRIIYHIETGHALFVHQKRA